jgi:hypothetical protein
MLFPFSFMQSQGQPLLLDLYPNAAAAYSVRLLRTAYTGSAIRVRRSSDNAEQDIGFSGANLDTSSLTSFCSGTNGFVTTWYDQSGNARNATQTTALSQPQIVSSGSVILENGKPSFQFDGVDDYIGSTITNFQNYTNLSAINVFSTAIAAASDTNSYLGWSWGKFGTPNKVIAYSSSTGALSGEKILISFPNGTDRRLGSTTYTRAANDQNLLTSFNLSSGTSLFSNGSSVSLDLSINATTSTNSSPSSTTYTDDNNVYLGAIFLTSGSVIISPQMKYQELIFYPSDQSSNRTGIETNINDFYSIY